MLQLRGMRIILLAFWIAIIYIIFTVNFIGNFVSHSGG